MKNAYVHKLEIFVGSTKKDLPQVRNEIIESILEAGHIPSGMELWASGAEPLITDIKSHLVRCDAHIIVLGAKYGAYVVDSETSFTEWEYKQSLEADRPVFGFVLDDKLFEQLLTKSDEDESKKEKIKAFRETLLKKCFCTKFENSPTGIKKLGRQCINSINEYINTRGIPEDKGWIRADTEEAVKLRKISNNTFLMNQITRLSTFAVVGERTVLDKVTKEKQADIFWQRMLGPIRRNKYWGIFFESGSTLAYVSDRYQQFVIEHGGESKPWKIWTNNVLSLFQLLLYTDVNIVRFPASSPDPNDRYGAIFPREWAKLHEFPPSLPRSLYTEESEEVDKMRKRLQQFGEKTVFLATTSCWDLNHKTPDFRGPHIGSHSNMLFKRALFTTGRPVVIFMNAEKLGDPFKEGECYPVFGPDLPLKTALDNYPLALCVGYDQQTSSQTKRGIDQEERKIRNNPKNIVKSLNDLGLKSMYTSSTTNETGAIIAGNDVFQKLLPL